MLNLARARLRIKQFTASAPRQWFTWTEAREYLMKAKVDSEVYAYTGDGKTEIVYGAYSVDAKPYKGSQLFNRKDLNNLIGMVQEDRRDKGLPLEASNKPTILKNASFKTLQKLLKTAQYEELKGLISGKDVYWWNNLEDWHHHHQYEALGKGADPTDPFIKNPTWNKDGLTIMPIKQDMGDKEKPLEGYALVNKSSGEGVSYIMKNTYLKKMILDNDLFVDNPKYKFNKEELEFIKGREYLKQYKLEAADDPYGWWITDTGSLLKVPTDLMGHIGVLEMHEKQTDLDLSNKDWDDINDANYAPVLKKGWIRIVFEGYDKIGIEIYKGSVTQKAATKLTHVLGRKRYSNYTLDINKDADRVDIDYVDSENKGPILSKVSQNISKTLVEAYDESDFECWITPEGVIPSPMSHLRTLKSIVAKNSKYKKLMKSDGFGSNNEAYYFGTKTLGFIRVVYTAQSPSIMFCEKAVDPTVYKLFTSYFKEKVDKDTLVMCDSFDADTEEYKAKINYKEFKQQPALFKYVRDNVKKINVQASDNYGAWITNEGKIIEVDEEQHYTAADKYIVGNLYEEFASFVKETDIMSSTAFCLNKGWIRIVNTRNAMLVELGENKVTKQAYRSLVKYVDESPLNEYTLEVNNFDYSSMTHKYENFHSSLRNPRQRFLTAVRENISNSSIVASILEPTAKSEVTLDEDNNKLPDNSSIVESWHSPEGHKIHLLSMLINGNEVPKYTILSYSPTGQMTRDDPEYDFLETAREGLLEIVEAAKPDIVYSRIGEVMAADDDPKTLERYESAEGDVALELTTQGKGFDIVQYQRNKITKNWQKMGASYIPTKEAAEEDFRRILSSLKSLNLQKVELGVKIAPRSNKDGFKLYSKQPEVPGLEVQVEQNGKTRYAKVIHKDSGRTVFAFIDKPLTIGFDELINRINLSKDLAAIDWTLSPSKLDQTYGQTQVLNKVARFKESLVVPLPANISNLSGRTEIEMEQEGLKGWVKDFLIARYFGRVDAVKGIRQNIDRAIEKKGLDKDQVYNYYGNPSKPEDKVWEKIGLTRTRKGTNYVYEYASKHEIWTWEVNKNKNIKAFYLIKVNDKVIASISVKDQPFVEAIVDLGNGKTNSGSSIYFKDLSIVKDLKAVNVSYKNILSGGKIIGQAYNPPFTLYGIMHKLSGGEVFKYDQDKTVERGKKVSTVKPKTNPTPSNSNQSMVGFQVQGETGAGKKVKGILIEQNTVKGKTSGVVLYMKSGKAVKAAVSRVFRVYEDIDKNLLKAAKIEIAKVRIKERG